MSKRGKISNDLLQKIKNAVNIVEVIGEHVVLRKSGTNYSGLCPFHSERSPSFSVSEQKQLYHCYGCKAGGDLISFVMEIQGVSFSEAIEDLADRARLSLPSEWSGASQDPNASREQAEAKARLALSFKLNRFVAAYYHQNLTGHPKARDYLEKRGVQGDLIKSFYLGVAANSWDDLGNFLAKRKAPLDVAQSLGLIHPSKGAKGEARAGMGYFDHFRGRIVFPILNSRGKVAGFGGRTLDGENPKYLNSPDSAVFQKSKLMFGLYQAQKEIREKDEVIVVEGYFDVLALHAAGFRNVVATCGTALTQEHLTQLKRFTEKVVLLFDQDAAGIAATERAMELGLSLGWVLYGAKVPEGVDPDEVLLDIKTGKILDEGKQKMNSIIDQATPLIDARIEECMGDPNQGPEALTQSLKKISHWLKLFQDPLGREIRIQQLEKKFGVSPRLLGEVMGLPKRPEKAEIVPKGNVNQKIKFVKPASRTAQGRVETTFSRVDKILIAGLVHGEDYSRALIEIRDKLPPGGRISDLWTYFPAREFIEKLISQPGFLEQLKFIPDTLWNEGEVVDVHIRSTVTEAMIAGAPLFTIEEFKGVLSRRQYQLWARFSQWVKEQIAHAEATKDTHLQVQRMKEYLDVQHKMKELTNFYDEE